MRVADTRQGLIKGKEGGNLGLETDGLGHEFLGPVQLPLEFAKAEAWRVRRQQRSSCESFVVSNYPLRWDLQRLDRGRQGLRWDVLAL